MSYFIIVPVITTGNLPIVMTDVKMFMFLTNINRPSIVLIELETKVI